MRGWIVGTFAFALVLASSAAQARDIPSGGLTLEDVVTWLHAQGYKAQIVSTEHGKHVESATGGYTFGVYMYDCKDSRCGSLQFAAGWATHGSFNTMRMNEWNRGNRWARGYFDSSNDPWVEMDVDLTPGGTYELLNDELATWSTTIAHFAQLYGLH